MNRKVFLEGLQINPENSKVIAVVGGGGKTSLIYKLTEELVSMGKRVIITTTTHMAYDEKRPFSENGNPKTVKKNLGEFGYTVAASFANTLTCKGERKIHSLQNHRLEEMVTECDVLLIEADGARHKPIKVPAFWEPVIPDLADTVIGVIGLDCLGKTIEETSHRPEFVGAFLGKELSHPVTELDVFEIAVSNMGLQKCVEDRDFRVFLNKADLMDNEESAEKICRDLGKEELICAYGSLEKGWIKTL